MTGLQWLSGRVLDSSQGATSSSLTGVTALCPWARLIKPSIVHVLVQPRKTHPFITEILLMGRKESNQTNKSITPASNLGCLAPTGQFFMGAKLFIGTPPHTPNAKRSCPKKILVWAMWKRMVSMATHGKFENGDLPTKLLISQSFLILDF